MDIVCFGQQNWDVCWTAKQHLMSRCARRGHRVLYVDPDPTPAAAAGANAGGAGAGGFGRSVADALLAAAPGWTRYGLRQLQPGLWIYNFHRPALVPARLHGRLWWRALRALTEYLHFHAPVTLSLRPDRRGLIPAVRPRARVYYAVDEWTAFGGLSESYRALLRAEEEATLRECEVALAVSPRLVERFARIQPRSYLQENAADVEHFSPASLAAAEPHPALANLPQPRMGFVGQLDERLDQDLLLEIARRRPAWQIVLAGRTKDGVDVSRLQGRPNIHLLGYQPYAALPGVVREFDACLVPYHLTELSQSCNPLKVYEYLATGLPVVSSPLAGLNAARSAVAVAATTDEFVAALDAALADPRAGRDGRLAVAAANTWDDRTDLLEARLAEALDVAAAAAPPMPRPTLSPRRIRPEIDLRLDPKDAAERQLQHDLAAHRPSGFQRAFFHVTRVAGLAYYTARVAGRLLRGRRPLAVRSILVVRRAYLGDLIACLPMLAALRRGCPDARIVLGVHREFAAHELLEGSADVDEIQVLDFMGDPSRLRRFAGAWRLFRQGFDVMISGVGYFLIRDAFYCGAPRRLGLYDGHPLQLLNTHLVALDPNRHEAENNLALAEALSCGAVGPQRAPSLPLAAARKDPVLPKSIPAQAPVLTVHAGSKRPSRRWPAGRFAAAVGRLLCERPDLHAVLTGVVDERPLVDEILAALPAAVRARAHAAAGETTLAALVALLDRSAVVLSNDTGIMHLARARGRPLVALLGPENDRRWGPHPLGDAPAIALRCEVPCAPCVRWDCESLHCMRALSAAAVADAVAALLDGCGPAAGATAMDRRLTRLSWRQLANSGNALPAVSVIVFASGVADADAVAAAVAALRRQNYPHVQVVAVGDAGRAARSMETGGARGNGWTYVNCDVDENRAGGCAGAALAWHVGLSRASGDFVVGLCAEDTACWAPDKLAADVAALIRSPKAAAAASPHLFDRLDPCVTAWPPPQSLTVRRTALEQAFAAVSGGTGASQPLLQRTSASGTIFSVVGESASP